MPRGLQAELKQKILFSSREQEAYLSLLRTVDALRILRGAGAEGLPCREIGERMITHDPDITRLLNRLEDRGLVERTRARHDRRVIYGKITTAGLKLLRGMDGPIEKHGREMLRHVGQKELKELIEL